MASWMTLGCPTALRFQHGTVKMSMGMNVTFGLVPGGEVKILLVLLPTTDKFLNFLLGTRQTLHVPELPSLAEMKIKAMLSIPLASSTEPLGGLRRRFPKCE